MANAYLTFSISLKKIWVERPDSYEIEAYTGGRGGSKTPGAVDSLVMNNVFFMGQKTNHSTNTVGGPLPIGPYEIAVPYKHPRLGMCAYLKPAGLAEMLGKLLDRDGFFIHGRGKRGSDGCIVPSSGESFQKLMATLTKSKGGQILVIL